MKLNDYTGMRLENATIISKAESRNGATRWNVKCDCGTEFMAWASHISRGTTKRCIACRINKQVEDNWSGVGDISYAYYNDLIRGGSGEKNNRVSRRVKVWELTIEMLWELFLKQDKKCALSGVPLSFNGRGMKVKYRSENQTASLDRIDSNGDYTIDNVQWVHKDVNRMKNIYDQDYFIEMCKNIALNAGGGCEVK